MKLTSDQLHHLIMGYMLNNNLTELMIYQSKENDGKKIALHFYSGSDEKGYFVKIVLQDCDGKH